MALPVSPDNPYGLGDDTRDTPVRSESESGRDYNWATQRTWKVVNLAANRRGTGGLQARAEGVHPTADGCVDAAVRARAGDRPPALGDARASDERWPCGAYPTQSDADGGITRWIADDEPLEDVDVVLWYVFGIHHITRVEDWPIMPVDTCPSG